MTDTFPNAPLDALGTPIEVGDIIAVGARQGNDGKLVFREVLEIKKDGTRYYSGDTTKWKLRVQPAGFVTYNRDWATRADHRAAWMEKHENTLVVTEMPIIQDALFCTRLRAQKAE